MIMKIDGNSGNLISYTKMSKIEMIEYMRFIIIIKTFSGADFVILNQHFQG